MNPTYDALNDLINTKLELNMEIDKEKIQHIPWEDNSIVDSLAKSVHSKRLDLRLIEDPPL
ncbi:hypothetical protein Golob_011222, partial [Gossypium lobatum]|nr:hypothetical protein [Gossypium lobatum]